MSGLSSHGDRQFLYWGKTVDPRRRTWLAWLGMGLLLPTTLVRGVVAQEASPRVIEVRIEKREVVARQEAIRITQGDVIELRWSSDEAVELHLHGYDIELHVGPDEPAAMAIEAFAAGRFPITSHGWGGGGDSGGGHDALTYLEVYPD
jgi:hypothetical protein